MKTNKKNIYMYLMIIIFININIILIHAEVPKIIPYVNDYANILTPEEENNLNLYADSIEKNTTYEIAIVTISTTEGQDRIEFANKIGDLNGVGKKDKDNGIVILWSLDNEHGGAIATGRFSESIINDAKAGRIGRASLSYFNNQSYYEGFNFILNEIDKELKSGTISLFPSSDGLDNYMWVIIFIIIGIIIIIFLIIPYTRTSYSDSSGSSSGGISGIFTGSGSRGRSSGGTSFGGGGFGGGGSKFL